MAVGALLAGVLALVVLRPGEGDDAAVEQRQSQRAAVLDYASALEPVTRDGGRVVQLGLKAMVADLHGNPAADAELVRRAEGHVRELGTLRDRVVALRAPAFLEVTKGLFDHAMNDYVATARVLVAAGRATGDERAALVGLAIEMGEESDRFYEEAQSALARVRARLGIAADRGRSG